NGSLGTDHGAASVQFVWGSQVNSGVYGNAPDLVNLNSNGDLVYDIDYRAIYAEVLTDWFGMTLPEAREVLVKDDVIPVDVLRAQPSSVKNTPSFAGRMITNYPNPFIGSSMIAFELAQSENVFIQVSDVAGGSAQTVLDQRLAAGPQRIPIAVDGTGVYICTVRIGSTSHTHIMQAR
ncbi:MAG TPA: T9SS type A sorting domain-containing protein, partial [Candidatus Kapabacteria bacterium]|nr:T9SS type A sorting domain-containing protein [Candidatus Kapabacteria bacterium]